jgi:putative DNA primase/helicase
MTMVEAALRYASRGLAIFPVPPGSKKSHKSEKHSNGAKWGMTRDAEEIRRDFTQWPNAGIGIPTGAVNGIVVVETDTKVGGHKHDGALALKALEAKHGPLPNTLKAISPSGSVHRYFRHPGIKIRCSHSELGLGVDVKGDGGMVVAPPTRRRDGVYRWLNRNPIASMPAWLIELTREKPIPPSTVSRSEIVVSDRYALGALRSEIDNLSRVGDGDRNAALNRASFSLHQLVDLNLLNAGDVERELIRACEINGLIADRENGGIKRIRETIKSGAAGAKKNPRGRR